MCSRAAFCAGLDRPRSNGGKWVKSTRSDCAARDARRLAQFVHAKMEMNGGRACCTGQRDRRPCARNQQSYRDCRGGGAGLRHSTSQAASRFSRVTFNPSDVIQPGGDRPTRPISAALAAAAPWSKGRCAAIPLRGPPFRSSFAISSPRSTVTIGRVRAPSLIVARTRKAGTSQATKTQSRSSFIARSRS